MILGQLASKVNENNLPPALHMQAILKKNNHLCPSAIPIWDLVAFLLPTSSFGTTANIDNCCETQALSGHARCRRPAGRHNVLPR